MYILIFLLQLCNCFNFKLKIIKTPILNFPIKINQHHIIVLYNEYNKNNFYTIDFSPTNQNPKTLIKLLFGQNVSSIIKIRNFNYNESIYSKDFIKKWYNEKNISYDLIQDKPIQDFLYKYYFIKDDINLYNYNCQHFAKIINDDYNKLS